MKKIVRSLLFSSLTFSAMFADHAPDVRNGGNYPQTNTFIGYTRRDWNGFVYTQNKPYGDITLAGFYLEGLANDYGNTIVLAKPLVSSWDTTIFGRTVQFDGGVFNTRKDWKTWNFTSSRTRMIAIPDPDAGALRQNGDDVVATVTVSNGSQITYAVAYWRPGWATINLAGVKDWIPFKVSIPCPKLQSAVGRVSDLHLGFVNSSNMLWNDATQQAPGLVIEAYCAGWSKGLYFAENFALHPEIEGAITPIQ